MKNYLTTILLCLLVNQVIGQVYTPQNAHSHNDYAQEKLFHLAYNEGFGSIEADIHLVNSTLLVGHDTKDLKATNTLESLYLKPLVAYNQLDRKLQLLIDIKTNEKLSPYITFDNTLFDISIPLSSTGLHLIYRFSLLAFNDFIK